MVSPSTVRVQTGIQANPEHLDRRYIGRIAQPIEKKDAERQLVGVRLAERDVTDSVRDGLDRRIVRFDPRLHHRESGQCRRADAVRGTIEVLAVVHSA